MINEITKSEMKIILLELLKTIDKHCRKNGIRYSLSQGTLLGAVRHKGFIPWDDDIDIMMPRPDYEVFLKTFSYDKENVVLQTPQNDDAYCHPYAKVYDSRTVLQDAASLGGVYIDIWPIDGWPEYKYAEEYLLSVRKIEKKLSKTTKFYKIKNEHQWWYKIKHYLKQIFLPSRAVILKNLQEVINNHSYENSKYVGLLFGPYGTKEYYNRLIFENYNEIEFEGYKFICISDYNSYLTQLYGDYMTPPPIEKQVSHHYYTVYWK